MVISYIKPIWAYRGFIIGSIKREFQSKYRNSILGAVWTILNPLAMITVYTVVFAEVMRTKFPGVDSTYGYGIYLCSGVLTWGLFAEIVTRAQNVFLENANILKKLNFPRLSLPVIVVGNAAVNFSITFSIFTLFLLISGNFPGLPFLALVPLLALLSVFAIGLGITLGVLNVFFRDVGQIFGIFLTFWFWFTPIVYPKSILPESISPLMAFNPIANLISAFQDVLVTKHWPAWQSLISTAIVSVVLCAIGLQLFRKHAGELVDEL